MKQKVNLFVRLIDDIPYGDNYLDTTKIPYGDNYSDTTKIHHWQIYVNVVNDNSYWVVCGHDPQEALDRFLSFSNYELKDLYILT